MHNASTERLPLAIDRDHALEAILTSDYYDADTADRWGWMTRAVPDNDSTPPPTGSSPGSRPSTAPHWPTLLLVSAGGHAPRLQGLGRARPACICTL
ncbi:hypothetical protein [Streptomyces sp. NPDC101234]|uniref:hypothetical protein n=1 Tax=Streptomyces sp. NPDC101234 TaxID=3366138 RepID=UPI00380D624B